METDRDILEMVEGSLIAGGAGVSIGRNAFQHRDPERIVRVISEMVHHGATVEDGLKTMRGEAIAPLVDRKVAVAGS